MNILKIFKELDNIIDTLKAKILSLEKDKKILELRLFELKQGIKKI